ncbi:MAG: hypothetical protein ACYC28_15990 [Longimicrobiales bacterium]
MKIQRKMKVSGATVAGPDMMQVTLDEDRASDSAEPPIRGNMIVPEAFARDRLARHITITMEASD